METTDFSLDAALGILRRVHCGIAQQLEADEYVWYCSPDAEQHLMAATEKLVPVKQPGEVRRIDLWDQYGRGNVQRISKKHGITGHPRRRTGESIGTNNEFICFTADEAALLRRDLDELLPKPGDMRLLDLAEELSVGDWYIYNWLKRKRQSTQRLIYRGSLAVHLRSKQVEQLRAHVARFATVKHKVMTIKKMAEKTGLTVGFINTHLTDADLKESTIARKTDAMVPTRVWPEDEGLRIMRRLVAKWKRINGL